MIEMKKMIRTAISTALLIACMGPGLAVAHEGHGVIDSETALNIANKSVKQLTFKDLGYEIGKLDASWTSLTDSNFRVVQELDNTFIVSATNTTNNDVIYFEIAQNGKVLSIKGEPE
jgi:hypothetical protein